MMPASLSVLTGKEIHLVYEISLQLLQEHGLYLHSRKDIEFLADVGAKVGGNIWGIPVECCTGGFKRPPS